MLEIWVQIVLNTTLIVLVLIFHVFINFKVSPAITNLPVQVLVRMASSMLVVSVFNMIFFKSNK